MRLTLPRRRFRWSALAIVVVFTLVFLTLTPESMNSSLRRLSQLRAHLLSVPTPLSQPRQAFSTLSPSHETAKIGALLSTTQARPVSTSTTTMSDYKNEVDAAIKDNFVMVFSKSYCPVSRGPRFASVLEPFTDRALLRRVHSTAPTPRSCWERLPRTCRPRRSTRSSSTCPSVAIHDVWRPARS